MPIPIRLLMPLLFGAALFTCHLVQAQQPDALRIAEERYYHAEELYQKNMYAAARKEFTALQDAPFHNAELNVNARYYAASSAIQLFQKDAEIAMEQFVLEHPGSKWIQPAYFELADYNFRKKDYEQALTWFKQTDSGKVPALKRDEYNFKRGYAHFAQGEYPQAVTYLQPVAGSSGNYRHPASYYLGHIAYEGGNYQEALERFEEVKSAEGFSALVPYYIAQIYYLQQRYDELLAYAPAILDSAKTKKAGEISRLVGDAHYRRGAYAEAFPYLKRAADEAGAASREEWYQVGYAAYQAGEYAAALDYFARISDEQDALNQLATYQMGDCYLRLEQKTYARNAFRAAGSYDFDREITEDALFQYAKLSYELSYDPFDEAIQAFKGYLKRYPDSPRKDEAWEFLLKVYLSTKNYGSALEALNEIGALDARHHSAWQLSAYNYGVQLYQQGQTEEALTNFEKSRKYQTDEKLTALSYYWQAEGQFRLKNYSGSARSYERFRTTPGAYTSGVYNEATYGLGYALFRQERYAQAGLEFRKYLDAVAESDMRRADAAARAADCYLVAKDYAMAQKLYAEAAKSSKLADYALFQQGMTHGYQGNYKQKSATLASLVEKYPESKLVAAAHYEAGDAALIANELQEANRHFGEVISKHSNSVYAKKSLLKNGLVLYRQGRTDDAIASFKRVMEGFPQDKDSREALNILENIYVELGRVDEYSAWINDLPGYDISSSNLDSLSYQAFESRYGKDGCAGSQTALQNYLEQFPNGNFAVNAHFYRAECLFEQQAFEEALESYRFVTDKPVNSFTEPALLGMATILYRNKVYAEALEAYTRLEQVASFENNTLEAQIGMLRCQYYLENYREALELTGTVLGNEKTPESIRHEARLFQGRIQLSTNNLDAAEASFGELAGKVKSEVGAEAQYNLAYISYLRREFAKSEAGVFELVKQYPASQRWKVKGFLLLADVYVALDDLFQARATLQSILNNVKDEEALSGARSRLDEVERLEASKNAPPEIPADSLELNATPGDTLNTTPNEIQNDQD